MSETASSTAEQPALRAAVAALSECVAAALKAPVRLMCYPPPPREPYPYGDLVPLGLAHLGLRRAAELTGSDSLVALSEATATHLRDRKVRGLWAYESGTLETSIDSSLILLGLNDAEAVAQLERFAVDGGYLPQLSTSGVEPGRMTLRPSLAHWDQPDFTIACLVKALRHRHGLEPTVSVQRLHDGFQTRSGLYLANPWFPDWLLALALEGDPEAVELRARLLGEMLAAQQEDGSFGQFDAVLSTALAILAIESLSPGAPAAALGRAALEQMLSAGFGIPATPFYSAERAAWSKQPAWNLIAALMSKGKAQLIRSGGDEFELTLYRDEDGLVVLGLTVLALLGGRVVTGPQAGAVAAPHGRYLCASVEEYVSSFALPPYVTPEPPAR